jgi:flagellar protein FlaI
VFAQTGPGATPQIDSTPQVPQEEVQETFKEHYPLLLPFSYAAIVEDDKSELKYSILEPTLTELDNKWVNEIKGILWDELSVNTKGFKNKEDADEFLKLKILETSLKYKINVDANTLGKYQYFIARDFLGFGKIDGIMRDENIEDVSCDGMNSPVFVWHRKYESIPSNIRFDSAEELENFVFNSHTSVEDTYPLHNQSLTAHFQMEAAPK